MQDSELGLVVGGPDNYCYNLLLDDWEPRFSELSETT